MISENKFLNSFKYLINPQSFQRCLKCSFLFSKHLFSEQELSSDINDLDLTGLVLVGHSKNYANAMYQLFQFSNKIG